MKTALPAERKTICTVSGTENAKTQLLSKDPEVKTSTCNAQSRRGTWRGFSLGMRVPFGKNRKDGSDWAVMKSICENVSVVPAPWNSKQLPHALLVENCQLTNVRIHLEQLLIRPDVTAYKTLSMPPRQNEHNQAHERATSSEDET